LCGRNTQGPAHPLLFCRGYIWLFHKLFIYLECLFIAVQCLRQLVPNIMKVAYFGLNERDIAKSSGIFSSELVGGFVSDQVLLFGSRRICYFECISDPEFTLISERLPRIIFGVAC